MTCSIPVPEQARPCSQHRSEGLMQRADCKIRQPQETPTRVGLSHFCIADLAPQGAKIVMIEINPARGAAGWAPSARRVARSIEAGFAQQPCGPNAPGPAAFVAPSTR